MITLFDIPSTTPGISASPSVWKTRLCLNYKKLPFKVEWVEFPDIEALSKKYGFEPTRKRPDGSPLYTLPAIIDVDEETGRVKAAMSNSFTIARYLDEAYPNTPKLFIGSEEEIKEQEKLCIELPRIMLAGMSLVVFRAIDSVLNDASKVYYSSARARCVAGVSCRAPRRHPI